MKLDSTTVQLVLAIAEEGSISRAADRMGLAVAAASRRLTELEGQLALPLFKRVPHGALLTEAGGRLLEHVRQIDQLSQRLAGDAEALRQGRHGRIIIGAPKAAIIQFLAADIARLRAAWPGVSLKIVEENSRLVQQLLRDKVIDIGIFEKTAGFLDLPQHAYRQDRLVLVYSRRHFRFDAQPVGIDALLEQPVVSLGKGSAVLAALQRAWRSRGRGFANDLACSGFDTMLALVRHGLGVGLMPPEVLLSLRPEPEIAAAELAGDWHQRRYVLSVVPGRAQRQTLRNVVQQLLGPDAPVTG